MGWNVIDSSGNIKVKGSSGAVGPQGPTGPTGPTGAGSANFVSKPSDTTRITGALSNDPDLTFNGTATGVYFVELYLVGTAVDTNTNIKFTFSLPTGATGYLGVNSAWDSLAQPNSWSWVGALNGASKLASATGNITGTVSTGPVGISAASIIIMDGTHAGAIALNWGCNTSGAGTTLKKGSMLRYTALS